MQNWPASSVMAKTSASSMVRGLMPCALWIADMYGFALAGLLVTMGGIGDRIGRKKLLLIGTTAFAATSALTAYAASAGMLIAARALMGVAGAPLPFYAGYVNPDGAFNLAYAVNTIAMPLIGGAGTWLGPVIGAVLLASLQQAATVTISSALNLWIVGWMLVLFVALAPRGILGWFRKR